MKILIKNWIKLLLLILLSACGSKVQKINEDSNKILISGTVSYPDINGYIVLEELLVTGEIGTRDTITFNSEDYTYSITKPITSAGIYRLNFYDKQHVSLILDKDSVKVRVDGNNSNGFVEITGSSDHKYLEDFQAFIVDFQQSEEVQQLNTKFQEISAAGDEEGMDSLRNQYAKMAESHNDQLAQKVLGMGTSLASLQVISSLDKGKYFDTYVTLAERLEKAYADNQFVKQFLDQVNTLKKLATGMVAPDIALPNPDGKIVKLSSLRGKYVLVDFWAMWCRPCRMENPNVVRAYNKYNKKGFEVYGVSLDRTKEEWLQAIEEDGLHWTQVSDLKFWQSEAAKLYNVTGIPFTVLLDKEGRIIAKNLRGQALEDKLEELLGAGSM